MARRACARRSRSIPASGCAATRACESLIADYKWAIDIEICVFPQEGLISFPGTDELLVEGLRRGAKVLGGAPRYDTDEAGQIRRIFELAREFDVDIDIHLDVGNTPDAMNIHLVRELTDRYRRGGRVVVGHMAKLSLLPPDELAVLARQMADSGIAVTVLPATDLFLMGRDREHSGGARRRGCEFPVRARRQLLAFLQQHPQSGDALWRLLADPHGEPLCQCAAGRSRRRVCATASTCSPRARRG